MDTFPKFLNSLKDESNNSLIETISIGYHSLFENTEYKIEQKPVKGNFKQLTAYQDGKSVGFVAIAPDNPKPEMVTIEYIRTKDDMLKQGVATGLINELKKRYPKYELVGIPKTDESIGLFNKMGIINILDNPDLL